MLVAPAEIIKRSHGGGDRVVLIAFALPDHEESPLLLLSKGRIRRSQADGHYQDVPKQVHHSLPNSIGDSVQGPQRATGCGGLLLVRTDSDSIKSRMNSAASWAF